ncbi:MAG: C69 family dipeptidase [Acetilactobacillus jinshanensis]
MAPWIKPLNQLTKSTAKTTHHITAMTKALISSLIKQCLNKSHINF